MVATHNFHKNYAKVLLQKIAQLKLQYGDLMRAFCYNGARNKFTATLCWAALPNTLTESHY